MTLKEFKAKHSDIVLDEVKWADLDKLANGAALFYVSLTGKKQPKEDRTIRCASHVLTVGMQNPVNPQLIFVRITTSGNTKVDGVTENDLLPNGRAMLFHTAPLADSDPPQPQTVEQMELNQ